MQNYRESKTSTEQKKKHNEYQRNYRKSRIYNINTLITDFHHIVSQGHFMSVHVVIRLGRKIVFLMLLS